MAKRSKETHTLHVDGRDVSVTNLEKVLYPEARFTKAQVIDYYIRVSEYLLPHFHNRPVTLKRYPSGKVKLVVVNRPPTSGMRPQRTKLVVEL